MKRIEMIRSQKGVTYILHELTLITAIFLHSILILLPFYLNKAYLFPEDDIYASIGIKDVQPFSWPLVGDLLEWIAIFSSFICPILIIVFSLRILLTVITRHHQISKIRMIYWASLIMVGILVIVLTWINGVKIGNWLTD